MGRSAKYTKELNGNYPQIEKGLKKISEKNVIELKTGKSHIIKILFECIKNFLNETNIVFTSEYIIILNQDTSGKVVIHIELNANEFEHYFCDQKRVIGIDVIEFYKISKTSTNSDILSIFVEYENNDEMIIITENKDTRQAIENRMRTLDIDEEDSEIPDLEFNNIIDFPSQTFQKICKDFDSFKIKNIEIKSIDSQFIISSFSNDKNGEIKRKVILNIADDKNEKNICFLKHDQDYIYQGIFNLKYFVSFIRATSLSNTVTLYYENNHPLLLEYKIVNLGILRFLVEPLPF